MNRPRSVRFDPVAVISDAGQLVGIVRMERMVAMLARLVVPT